MKLVKLTLFALISIGLSGCLTATPVTSTKTYTDNDSLTVLVPEKLYNGEPINSASNLMEHLSVPNKYKRYGSKRQFISSLKWKWGEDSFEAIRFACLKGIDKQVCNEFSEARITLKGDLDMGKSGKNISLKIKPKSQTYSYTNDDYKLKFTSKEKKGSLSNSSLFWKFEINSDYPSEAVYSNFARLTKKEVFRNEGKADPVTGKIFKERYWVKIENIEIPVTVETFPYRNGSKAIIYANIKPSIKGNTYDYTSIIEKLQKELREIVES
jgi:hypothetical protein